MTASRATTILSALLAAAGLLCGCSGSSQPAGRSSTRPSAATSSATSSATSAATGAAGLASTADSNAVTTAVKPSASSIAPLIAASSSGSPYFADPYPVYEVRHGTSAPDPHIVFGTRQEMLTCPGAIKTGCYTQIPIHVQLDTALRQQLASSGNQVVSTFNHNPLRDGSGRWQMALSVTVRHGAASSKNPTWSVILHAHPSDASSPAPDRWVADATLEGSLRTSARANYDGKYFVDHDVLYLVYSRRLSEHPAHDGIVAQRMSSATTLAHSSPVTLLAPAPGAGFSSEKFYGDRPKDDFKLIETGNITKVGDRYAMAYSTGAFTTDFYKSGIAWSDTFLPRSGATYRKNVVADASDVWHNPTRHDVRYVLQSEKPNWPGYSGAVVHAPGVPSIVSVNGGWDMIFAGYPTGAHDRAPGGGFQPALRVPYLAELSGLGAEN